MKRISRFFIVGVAAFVLDASLLQCFLALNQHLLLSNTLSFSIATLFNFVASYFWVNESHKPIQQVFLPFLFLSVCGLVLNWILLPIFYSIMQESLWISKGITTVLVMLFNYFTRLILLEGEEPTHG
ncbi:GtrA family protein [Faecalicoccus pleomorphus]|uniref:GtrA family protein n=1 Tax=Faecalicoccus pleomorphus TaxID=1323 RepID=UPI00294329F4|nr:GtrA family protein [Faecalicoccus pleomorphus]